MFRIKKEKILLILLILSEKSACRALSSIILDVKESYTESDRMYFDRYGDRSVESDTSDLKEILLGLQIIDTASLDMEHYRQWVWNIGQKRVNHIVSNTHRGRYNRHSAFRGEMRGIVSKSRVLCGMAEGL